MSYSHVDCFSGPGGICTGFHAAGIDTKIAIENVQSCVDTYRANHPEVKVFCTDIRKIEASEILPFLPQGDVDIVSSGMPCETFSTAGNTSRSFYDDRQYLFREGIRIAKIANAKLILFENVPGITSKRTNRDSTALIVDVLKEELEQAGYGNYIEVVLNSADFGVPQKRNRFFILASRYPSWTLKAPLSEQRKEVTVSEAFAGLLNVIPNSNKEEKEYSSTSSSYSTLMRNNLFWKRGNEVCNVVTYHMPMKHRACTLERFRMLNQGESLKDLFLRFTGKAREELQARRVLPKKLFIKRNYRLRQNESSPTLTSHCLDEFVHPLYDRALTVRECARLQSFPDSYDFCGGPYLIPHIDRTIQDKYEQIGDAVPPLLAYAWGKTIAEIISEHSNEK